MCREQQQVISFNDRYSGKMGGWQTDAVSACLAEYRRKAFALIFMDLDFFKPVNDTYGHPAGDEVLCNVGKRIINSNFSAEYPSNGYCTPSHKLFPIANISHNRCILYIIADV